MPINTKLQKNRMLFITGCWLNPFYPEYAPDVLWYGYVLFFINTPFPVEYA